MNWDIVSAIADAFAAIAVVISLLYLARQIRDGATSTATATHFEITQALNDTFFDIAKDPELSRIYTQGNRACSTGGRTAGTTICRDCR